MKDYFSYVFNKARIKLVFTDQVMLFFSVFFAYLIRGSYNKKPFSFAVLEKVLFVYLILFPLIVFSFYIFGIYERWEIGNFSKSVVKILFSLILVAFVSGFVFYFIPRYFVGRLVFILFFSFYFLFLSIYRFGFFLRAEKKMEKQNVFFIGLTESVRNGIAVELENNPFFNLDFVEDNKIESFLKEIKKKDDKKTVYVFSFRNTKIKDKIEEIIELKLRGFFIYDFESFYMSMRGKVFDINFENVWRIVYERNYLTSLSSYYKVKRVFDIMGASFLLFLSSPLFLMTAFLIKITSKGPIFFIQERLGWYKKPFRLIKFRTMIVDAEKQTGPKWAGKDDPRITKVGKFLRRTRIDEIPQLINVLKGDMSLVGNRPIRKYFADQLKKEIPFYDLRFFIKPGLTGWSQVKMGYINTVEQQIEKFKYELFYIKNMSLLLDLIILIKTIKTVLNFKGN